MNNEFLSFESSGSGTGEVQHITVFSPSLGRRGDISVYMPSVVRSSTVDIPLVILLHGVYGSHWSWYRNGNAPRTLEQLVTSGQIAPCAIAMPSDGLFGLGSGYVPNGEEDAGAWIAIDVPNAVNRLYPRVGSQGMSVIGLSMGGFGAMHLKARFPNLVKAAVAMSPISSVSGIAEFTGVPLHSPHQTASRKTLVETLAECGIRPGALAIDCGMGDALLDECRLLHRDLLDAGVAHDYEEAAGGHNWDYWSRRLSHALEFCSRYED